MTHGIRTAGLLLAAWALPAAAGSGQTGEPDADLVRRYLLEPRGAAARSLLARLVDRLGDRFRALDALEAARRPSSPPPRSGYQVVPTGAGPLALLVPGKARPKPRPLVLAAEPAGPNRPPDELPLRALYSTYLEAGWAVAVPARPLFPMGEQAPPDVGALLAALALHLPYDRDRVLLLGPLRAGGVLEPPAGPAFRGETTGLAAFQVPLPASSEPDPALRPGPWAGRLLVLHHGRHAPETLKLTALRLGGGPRGPRVKLLEDRNLDWPGHLTLRGAAPAAILQEVRRPEAAQRLDLTAGGAGPRAFEWLVLQGRPGAFRLRAHREGDALHITTGTDPPPALLLRLPDSSGALTVTVDGQTRHTGPPRRGVRELLLAARHALRTGRTVQTVVEIPGQ